MPKGWGPLALHLILMGILSLRYKRRDWMISLALHLYQKFLHNYILVGDVSHISFHGGYISGELSNNPHPTMLMMVVGSIPNHWGSYWWGFVGVFTHPAGRNIVIQTHLSLIKSLNFPTFGTSSYLFSRINPFLRRMLNYFFQQVFFHEVCSWL